ncbi:hypothetical protein BRC89_13305 [Halobacteriales archaeon QS_4_70_19]|nr:MAG: hypothetical protein BRC89_13305 [Halobacteriales archaeon QS_4_70_19]
MDVSVWLVAALVLVPAAQVPLVLYLSRYVALEESERPGLPAAGTTTPSEWRPDETGPEPDGDEACCRRCGTANEQGYRFCRACTAPL